MQSSRWTFSRRFHEGKLGISDESAKVVKDLLILEETPEYRLSGKSGWVGLGEEGARQIGWQVGYVERKGLLLLCNVVDIERQGRRWSRLLTRRRWRQCRAPEALQPIADCPSSGSTTICAVTAGAGGRDLCLLCFEEKSLL